MVSCLIFQAFSHFEFIFLRGVKLELACSCPGFPAILAEKTVFFPFDGSGLVRQRLIDHRCLG